MSANASWWAALFSYTLYVLSESQSEYRACLWPKSESELYRTHYEIHRAVSPNTHRNTRLIKDPQTRYYRSLP